jgi:hypothetical protein
VAGDPVRLRDALSSILYWGFYRMGTRDHHIGDFPSKITADHLVRAAAVLPQLSGTGIRGLRALGVPQFGQFTFLSKLRTFLDPERYCVLDRMR